MFEKIISLQFGGFYGGDAGSLILYLEQVGAFSYIIPFLLLFVLIFGILMRANIFKDNKTINAIIALSVSLLSLQFGFVPIFFSEIFPRLGIGLIVILVALILGGLFFDPDSKFTNYILLIGAAIVFVVVLTKTAGYLGWTSYFWWAINWPAVIGIIIVLVVIAAAVGSFTGKQLTVPGYKGAWAQPLVPIPKS